MHGEASDVVVMVKVVGQTNQDWDYVWWAKFVLYNHPELSVRVLWNFATSCVDFETRFLPEKKLNKIELSKKNLKLSLVTAKLNQDTHIK